MTAAPLPAGLAAPLPVRVGVVASIASVGPAVRRNAAKRRLREIFRRHQTLVPPGQLGFCWQFVDPSGHATYRICLGDKWLALGLNDRGLVLLS